jgi:hypothetical protein
LKDTRASLVIESGAGGTRAIVSWPIEAEAAE